ncbi:hypothetical protein ABIB25_001068 [Nakamurella sp. UYEF19]|uniref:DUF1800 domain-containing protein n=1 Tax=Nakamurella sp. UYEF19 TaxID=1756392 RepID=UPI003397AE0F
MDSTMLMSGLSGTRGVSAAPVGPVPARPTVAQQYHLLSRFAFGGTPATLNVLAHQGPTAWWDGQVALGRQYPLYRAHGRVSTVGPMLNMSPVQVRAALKAGGNEYGWEMMDQLTLVTLGLQAWSPAQLYERVVDFFGNHLNIANHSDGQTWVRHLMDRDVVRKYAFGTFSDMLVASARNPAMLLFLNLAESTKRIVNENYGRELLELHTVGLGSGFTETDVKYSARILTGRTIDDAGNYVYRPDIHWTGPVRVLGFNHTNADAAAGVAVGDAYLRYLAGHPSTANNLARKLCVRFVSDNPSAALIALVAKTYLANGTAILPTIKAIFTSAEFWASKYQKVRRPAENLIATLRILDLNMAGNTRASLDTLHWMTASVGNAPLDWAPPNGYPDAAAAWRSSSNLLALWQAHRGFSQNWWKDLVAPANTTLYGAPATSGAAIAALISRLVGGPMTAAQVAALQAFLREPAATPMAQSNLRWYLDHLVPLILDSSYHALG